MKKGFIEINICSKDRPTELGLLLQSLRQQTYQLFDIFILDDASGTPIQQHHFLRCLFEKLRIEGHRIEVIRNGVSKGVSFSRQALADHCIKNGDGEFICRLDDDIILEPDYLAKLMSVIIAGYDLASGVTPPIAGKSIKRDVRFVSPIINRVVLDEEGRFINNGDDCGHEYLQDKILPTHHFRSCALYKKSIHQKVNYESCLTHCGFREEQFFSLRMILEGWKLGVHTGAKAWHLMTPSGGDRREQYREMSVQNQRILNRFVKDWFKQRGDFCLEYEQKLGINESREDRMKSIKKSNNLIYSREE